MAEHSDLTRLLLERIDELERMPHAEAAGDGRLLPPDAAAVLREQIVRAAALGDAHLTDDLVWTRRRCYELHQQSMDALDRYIATWIPLSLVAYALAMVVLSNGPQVAGILAAGVVYAVFYVLFARTMVFVRMNRRYGIALERLLGGSMLAVKQRLLEEVRPRWLTSLHKIVRAFSLGYLAVLAISLAYVIAQ